MISTRDTYLKKRPMSIKREVTLSKHQLIEASSTVSFTIKTKVEFIAISKMSYKFDSMKKQERTED